MESSRGKNSLTPSQQRAVAARGNVLVMAGAGTGKTHTLVARCLNLICEEKNLLDEILIVTFTEAAAAEMRQRLRAALEKQSLKNSDPHLAEQLALFDAAHIGTLHSFCFKLVREHFHELGLDPQISILDEGQTRLLADETLDEQFNSHYENEDEFSVAVQELIKIYGNGRDENIRKLVLRLHHYLQTRADSEKWLAEQIENFSATEPKQWREWFADAIADWCNEWTPLLENLRGGNVKADECLEILKKFKSPETFQKILDADADWPRGTKKYREPLKDFFDDAKFLHSLFATKENNPLAEDWNWIRNHMRSLLQLAQEFSKQFSERKRADGVLDFHDLEQFSLKLLWNFETENRTEIAKRWREKLRFVFVDEYQDINAAQDKIISALSRSGKDANRFLVGDVKQSIYRFRLADPKIFRDYAHNWRGKNGQTIPLIENFRSREMILNFVNSLFEPLMREEIGGVNYDDEAKLKFGGNRSDINTNDGRPQGPELLLRIKKNRNDNFESDDELADLEESEREARLLATRLLELKNAGHDWRDMAILLRAPSGKAEIFAKQFEQMGIPLLVERGGFYDSSEISDLLCVLQLLDNPLQDVPLIAVLRSPLVGLSLDELAEIRLLQRDGKFWFALNKAQSSKLKAEPRGKVEKFLNRFARWRKIAKQVSLSQCLEEILDETYYADWLKAQSRGGQRCANVQRFLHLAEKFDEFQRQGLFRFLKFIEAQREIEAEPEVAPVAQENAVRLMSIHQSKGLEFPVVALADLAKQFNEQDLRGEIILDERFGLCPRVKPPKAGGRYPSLSYWLAQKNQRRELRGEEFRLLYVALTRARDNLILCGSISQKKWDSVWTKPNLVTVQSIVSAKSYADWLALWFKVQGSEFAAEDREGELSHLRWRIIDDTELALEKMEDAKRTTAKLPILDEKTKQKLQKTLEWQYEFAAATKRAAKSSVTVLRREANAELDEESEQAFANRKSQITNHKLSAIDAGLAHHKFLQHFKFESSKDFKSLEAEAKRLETESYLSADERAALDLKNLGAFWNSPEGRKIREQPTASVKRELPFTAKFSPQELDEILGTKSAGNLENEFIVVQGVADLVVLLPKEIWLVDFKTDNVRTNELAEKIKIYKPQLRLYALALEKIYSRPVKNCWLHFLSAQRTEKI
ncbi:MAG TPA: UvrD-helicase domain-containing protein [Candidatus Baltobacteraceae bacterium]|nr:UvrD-helicase domain-containing protein [Candidatus Baltobacteraceae bacterium]